jgi:hypothetical protein
MWNAEVNLCILLRIGAVAIACTVSEDNQLTLPTPLGRQLIFGKLGKTQPVLLKLFNLAAEYRHPLRVWVISP